MNDKPVLNRFLHKLGGYYLIPHELLHVLAYRLIGKPCEYKWGNYYVRPLAKRTRGQRLFVLLFPFGVCWVIGLVFHFLWVMSAVFFITIPFERYLVDGPTWHFTLPIIATLFIIYSGAGLGDLVISYNVLLGKDKSHEDSHQPRRQTKDEQTDWRQP